MKAMTALIRREFLEHRGAFLYAPAVLVGLLTLFITLGMVFGHTPTFTAHSVSHSATTLIQVGFGGIVGLWSIYLLIVLYFYYADAFSADTRNNSMLFWKSMPQSDIKILTSKALAGVTIFPALILGFALITMVLAYLLSFPLAARLPFIPIANPVDVVISMFTIGVSGAVLFILTILWYAPFLALVAGLSTLVKRWAIPAAVLFIGALILAEGIVTFGSADDFHPIRDYIAYRAESFAEGLDPMPVLAHGGAFAPFQILGETIARIDWAQMGVGILFAILVVYLASEYRRRRIDG